MKGNKTMSKNNNVTNNNANIKEEKEMANAYEDEMDLRSEEQLEAEEKEANKKELKNQDKEELSFYEKHKVPIWIGAGVAGVALLGFGAWGVHNVGMGRTFLGRPKFNGYHGGHKHSYNNYKMDTMPRQMEVPTQQLDIPATENEPAKVVNFADGAAKVADAAKTVSDLKVNNL